MPFDPYSLMEQQSLRDKKQFPSVKQVIFCGMQNCSSQMRALAATALTCAQHTSRMCQCVRTILKQGSRNTKREPQKADNSEKHSDISRNKQAGHFRRTGIISENGRNLGGNPDEPMFSAFRHRKL